MACVGSVAMLTLRGGGTGRAAAGTGDGGQEVRPSRNVKDEWAKLQAAGYAKADAQGRESMAQMPMLWAGLRAAWPELSGARREQITRSWAAMPQIRELSERLAKVRSEATASMSGGKGGIDMDAAIRKMQEKGANYQMLSNMLKMQHETRMQIIRNMGNDRWTYRYPYR